MTFQVLKSQVGDKDAFAAKVEAFRIAKLDHRFTEGVAAPTAAQVVERCVKRIKVGKNKPDHFEADYEWVDDQPPPTLEQLRQALMLKSKQQEADAINAIMTPAYRRKMHFDCEDAMLKLPENQGPEDVAALEVMAIFNDRVKKIQREGALREIEIENMSEAQVRAAQ